MRYLIYHETMTNHAAIAEKYMLLIFLFYYCTSKDAKTTVQGWL